MSKGQKTVITPDDMRDVWCIVTEHPGIPLRSIAQKMGWTLWKTVTIVGMLTKSGTLTHSSGKNGTLRATVPLVDMRTKLDN